MSDKVKAVPSVTADETARNTGGHSNYEANPCPLIVPQQAMNCKTADLVFLSPNQLDAEPFTTSQAIAAAIGYEHHSITRILRRHESDFEEFAPLRFMDAPSINPEGGRPQRTYSLTEEQATLLVTFLDNTRPVVRAFKVELVRQFYTMRKELLSRQVTRAALIPARRELTDIIKETNPGTWTYKNYMDLCYKAVLGMNAAQIRKEHNVPPKTNATDLLTSSQQAAVFEATRDAAVLRKLGVPYAQTKALLAQCFMRIEGRQRT